MEVELVTALLVEPLVKVVEPLVKVVQGEQAPVMNEGVCCGGDCCGINCCKCGPAVDYD